MERTPKIRAFREGQRKAHFQRRSEGPIKSWNSHHRGQGSRRAFAGLELCSEEERANQTLGRQSGEDNDMTGKRWGGGLERNEICGRLSVIVEA